MRYDFLSLVAVALLAACGRPSVPEHAQAVNALPEIYPDYVDVTIPANISPMNFMVRDADEVVARVTGGTKTYVYGDGNKVMMDEDEWREMLDEARGKSLKVEVWTRNGDMWTQYKSFKMDVANDTIDRYVSYRLIEPSYVAYEDVRIEQRDMTSFDTKDIYNNGLMQTEKDGQCINCHSYQNYGTQRMLFHIRHGYGGTMIYDNGELEKVDLKTDSTISPGVYPAWHPTLDIVAFSTNTTRQTFLTAHTDKVEVVDMASDMIVYDVKKHEVSTVAASKKELEVYPVWSPDGKFLYYCTAVVPVDENGNDLGDELARHYKEIKYSIVRRAFDAQTMTFGDAEMVYDAAGKDLSATLPRFSPDGEWLVFALAKYGCFHVWHSDADIHAFNVRTGEDHNLQGLNSDCSESYPSFSSNGRWVMAGSRRDDGNYTRPYISYYDESGRCTKAFELPQRDPEYYVGLLKSFNRPEFMREPVRTTPRQIMEKARLEAVKVRFVTR